MELGLHAKNVKLIVCYPEGFWRRRNVQIICEVFGIPFMDMREELKEQIKKRLEKIIEGREKSKIS
jgi:hypothetical protein